MVAINKFLEELGPLNEKSVFRTFFLFAYRYCFAIPRYRSSLSLIFPEVMALGFRKMSQNIRFPDVFVSLLTDIHFIFGTLFCHTKIQIKFEFGFDPLIFSKVMALGLRKIS
jgi:hypothetical protein